MSFDTPPPTRTIRILDEFTRKHETHMTTGSQLFRHVCPYCQIIVEEQSDRTYDIIVSLFSGIVARTLLDNPEMADHRPSELIGNLAFVAYQDWVQPRYVDIELSDEELMDHPFVRKKIHE